MRAMPVSRCVVAQVALKRQNIAMVLDKKHADRANLELKIASEIISPFIVDCPYAYIDGKDLVLTLRMLPGKWRRANPGRRLEGSEHAVTAAEPRMRRGLQLGGGCSAPLALPPTLLSVRLSV